MIKAPHWKWYVPCYFFIAGITAGAAFFGALARFFGGPRHRVTVRHARYIALVLALICPVLLILDLERPRRFFHMLRVVKVRSPLSLGTWILMAFGVTSGLLAARQMAEDGVILRRRSFLSRLALLLPDRLLTLIHGALGLGLGGDTGVLLAATAVPLWAAAGILLGPLFLAASITSGAAALILLGLLSAGRVEVRALIWRSWRALAQSHSWALRRRTRRSFRSVLASHCGMASGDASSAMAFSAVG